MGIGIQSLIKRVPILIGPIAGGLLMDRFGIVTGVRAGAVVAVAFGLMALIAQSGLRGDKASAASVSSQASSVFSGFTPELKRLLASDILVRFSERIPAAWVVIYAIDHVGASASQVGLLIAVEMATAMICYIPAAHLADRYGKEPFVIATFVFFSMFPLAMLAANSFGFVMLAFVVRGLKEFGDSARKALIIGYAPPDRRGRVIGAYDLLRDLVVTPGVFLGAWLWKMGPRVTSGAAFMVGVAGTLAYAGTLRGVTHPEQR